MKYAILDEDDVVVNIVVGAPEFTTTKKFGLLHSETKLTIGDTYSSSEIDDTNREMQSEAYYKKNPNSRPKIDLEIIELSPSITLIDGVHVVIPTIDTDVHTIAFSADISDRHILFPLMTDNKTVVQVLGKVEDGILTIPTPKLPGEYRTSTELLVERIANANFAIDELVISVLV